MTWNTHASASRAVRWLEGEPLTPRCDGHRDSHQLPRTGAALGPNLGPKLLSAAWAA